MRKKAHSPISVKVRERNVGPKRELLLVSAFIKSYSDLWDPMDRLSQLAKAELRLWACSWALVTH
jgi:hypothetical protein